MGHLMAPVLESAEELSVRGLVGEELLVTVPGASPLWQQVAGDWESDTQHHRSAGLDPRTPSPYLGCPSGGPGMLRGWPPSKSQFLWAKDISLSPGLSEVAVKPSPACFDVTTFGRES